MTISHGDVFVTIARVELQAGLPVEDRETTTTAFIVTLVGDGDQVAADPAHRVGFALDLAETAGQTDDIVLDGIDCIKVHRAGAVVIENPTGAQVDVDG